MKASPTQHFPLAPADRRTQWFFPALWLALVVVACLVGSSQARIEPVSTWLIIPLTCSLAVLGPFILLQYRHIRIQGDALQVMAAALFSRTVAVAELDLDRARILNLDEHEAYRPWIRLFGIAIPGFTGGHCLLRNRKRAFCLLTNRERVLLLPRRDGRYLLLSPLQPGALLSRLRQLAGEPGRD